MLLAQGKQPHECFVSDGWPHVMMLLIDAKMLELSKYFIPKVTSKWEHLAYCMRYKPREVEAFKRDSQDINQCCTNLFSNWLETSHGPIPKTYQTLLNCIMKIKDLTAASEEIKKDLIEGKDKQIA